MPLSWHTMLEFDPPRIGCVVSETIALRSKMRWQGAHSAPPEEPETLGQVYPTQDAEQSLPVL
jgi:hypothetical protein